MSPESDEQSLIAFLERSGAEWIGAQCERHHVERLRGADHHVVTVEGRRGVLLSYHLWTEPPPSPSRVYILFQYADRHPTAPGDVQQMVAAIAWWRRSG